MENTIFNFKDKKNFSKSFLSIMGLAFIEKIILYEKFWEEAKFLDTLSLSFPNYYEFYKEIINFFKEIKKTYCKKSALLKLINLIKENLIQKNNLFKEFLKILIRENIREKFDSKFLNEIDSNVFTNLKKKNIT